MKNLFILLICILFTSPLKLSAAEGLNWQNDLAESQSIAEAENKPIILFFTGSDWCPTCIKLEENILSKEGFIQKVKDHLIFVLVDFPRHREIPEAEQQRNRSLLQKYQVQGFPTLIIVNDKMEKIGRTTYLKISPEDYAQHLLDSSNISEVNINHGITAP